jgi:2-polyprenyl-3-methyl-5-hydroxy-6-metoxy-1,4-benzoquinol methylase
MSNYYNYILDKVEAVNPIHAKKLRSLTSEFDDTYKSKFEIFFGRYEIILKQQNLSLDFAIESYLRFCSDMVYEQIRFIQTGEYSNKSFEEVNKNVYDNPDVMNYHMHGLLVSQFLWSHHYQTFRFFSKNIQSFAGDGKNILEIGGGHGLYTNELLDQFKHDFIFNMVDISESSIALSKSFVLSEKVNYYLEDIYKYNTETKFDFIIMGEVLEHVEDPVSLMIKLHNLGTKDVKAFISTPCNAPSIDHIYLFKNSEDVRKIFDLSGWKVITDNSVYSESKKSKSLVMPVPMMYAAFIEKK